MWPRLLIGGALLASLFVQTLERLLPLPGVSSLDEGFVALCVASILVPAALGGRLRGFPGLPWFGGFVALGLLSAVAQAVPLTGVAQGLLLAVKGVVVGWAGTQLGWGTPSLRRVARAGFAVSVFALACGVVNAMIPGPWTALIGNPSIPEYRGPFASLIGPWKHPSYFGQVMALVAIGLLAYRQVFSRTGR